MFKASNINITLRSADILSIFKISNCPINVFHRLNFFSKFINPQSSQGSCISFTCHTSLGSFEAMAHHSNILAWKILWMEKPGRL